MYMHTTRNEIFRKSRDAVVSSDPSVTTAQWTCVKCEKTFDCLKVMCGSYMNMLEFSILRFSLQISRVTGAVKAALDKLQPNMEQPKARK